MTAKKKKKPARRHRSLAPAPVTTAPMPPPEETPEEIVDDYVHMFEVRPIQFAGDPIDVVMSKINRIDLGWRR